MTEKVDDTVPFVPSLLPSECSSLLHQLWRGARSLSFDTTCSRLYAITSKTLRGKALVHKPGSSSSKMKQLWNFPCARHVISIMKEILLTIHDDMMWGDVTSIQFDPEKFEMEIRGVKSFACAIYHNYEVDFPLLNNTKTYSYQTFINVLPCCDKILKLVSVKIKFKTSPAITSPRNRLWSKLHHTSSISSLLELNSELCCPVCLKEELKEETNFAIVDCCHHIVCAACAKCLFDVRAYTKSPCPVCRQQVSAWTDSKHFRIFKSRPDVKTKLWCFLPKVFRICSMIHHQGTLR